MSLRAFPVLHAKDVEAVAGFYRGLGFDEHFRLPGEGGGAGYIGLRRGTAELAVTTEQAPATLAGVTPGPGPRHEMFIYVDDVDATVGALRAQGATVLRDPADMFWGERVAFVADPEGNLVSLAGVGSGVGAAGSSGRWGWLRLKLRVGIKLKLRLSLRLTSDV